jgi:hypothetical protein
MSHHFLESGQTPSRLQPQAPERVPHLMWVETRDSASLAHLRGEAPRVADRNQSSNPESQFHLERLRQRNAAHLAALGVVNHQNAVLEVRRLSADQLAPPQPGAETQTSDEPDPRID